MYSREAVLQSTAEPVPGLEHALSWRPSGNLIVGTQRFGNIPGESTPQSGGGSGLGQGRDGRHDIVFFERNGLRHGEFTLREWSPEHKATGERRWGYRVREVGWSSDSNVLSVWIERDDGDVGTCNLQMRASYASQNLQCNYGRPGIIIGIFLAKDLSACADLDIGTSSRRSLPRRALMAPPVALQPSSGTLRTRFESF